MDTSIKKYIVMAEGEIAFETFSTDAIEVMKLFIKDCKRKGKTPASPIVIAKTGEVLG